ncbi:MAG: glycosyltransferase family 9 protein, partial [Candidatus Delongbacteria bacterium]|nr:glycosyltransferase family 9 protein [Candidatus Delongbacteria bacterium]
MTNKVGRILTAEELAQVKRILIIQYKPFGDVLLNTAYLPALRKKFPEATIDYLVMKPFKVIIEDNPNLNNLILMEKKKGKTFAYYMERIRTIIKVRKLKYDMIIDTIRGPGSSQITFFSGAKFRLGWNRNRSWIFLFGYNWVYNFREIRDHKIYAGRAKFMLLKPLGIKETGDNIFYHVKPESVEYINNWLNEVNPTNKKLVVFSPVTPVPRKQWEFERFAKVADMIKENTDCEVILLWGPGELEKVESMASLMKTKPVIAPKTTFNQAGALLQRTFIYIGNDGGINHLAVSQNTPTIAVFGPKTNPLKWTAWHLPIHKYLRDFDFKDPKDNSFNITPEMVYDKFVELMQFLNER